MRLYILKLYIPYSLLGEALNITSRAFSVRKGSEHFFLEAVNINCPMDPSRTPEKPSLFVKICGTSVPLDTPIFKKERII